MNELDEYFKIQEKIYDYFGYKEDWVVIPIEDARSMYWILDQNTDGTGTVRFAETEEKLFSDGNYYENVIYTQRFLPKWVYPGKDFTMICIDARTDGNKFLQIFSNDFRKEMRD